MDDATLGGWPVSHYWGTLVIMIDIRDANGMVARLRDVQRRFEKGAPVPHAARELLVELLDALADSGPIELGVTPTAWLDSIDWAERGITAADASPSPKTVRQTKRSIRELKAFFGQRDWIWSDWLVLPFVALFLLSQLIFMGPVLLPVFVLIYVFERRYIPNAREVAIGLELPERLLFAHAVKRARSEAPSATRARLGAYVHPVLIATDRRVVLAQPSSERPFRSRQHRFAVGWEIPHPYIQSFSAHTTPKGEEVTVSIQTAEREVTQQMPGSVATALLDILKRRIPEGLDRSWASNSSESNVLL